MFPRLRFFFFLPRSLWCLRQIIRSISFFHPFLYFLSSFFVLFVIYPSKKFPLCYQMRPFGTDSLLSSSPCSTRLIISLYFGKNIHILCATPPSLSPKLSYWHVSFFMTLYQLFFPSSVTVSNFFPLCLGHCYQ